MQPKQKMPPLTKKNHPNNQNKHQPPQQYFKDYISKYNTSFLPTLKSLLQKLGTLHAAIIRKKSVSMKSLTLGRYRNLLHASAKSAVLLSLAELKFLGFCIL